MDAVGRNERKTETLLVRDSDHAFPNHAHDGYYVIGCMLRGASWCFGPSRDDAVVSDGRYCMFNPSQVHSGVPIGGGRTTYRMIYIPEETFAGAFSDCRDGSPAAPEFESSVAFLPEGPDLIYRACASAEGRFDQLEAETHFLEFVGALASAPGLLSRSRLKDAPAAALRSHPGLRRAAELLASDPARKMELDELAREAGLSKYHFIRSFKRAFGVPPHTYRTQARVEYAKALVAAGTPFADIAYEAGFSDQSHFQRSFKTFVGLTPGRFREERKGNSIQYGDARHR